MPGDFALSVIWTQPSFLNDRRRQGLDFYVFFWEIEKNLTVDATPASSG